MTNRQQHGPAETAPYTTGEYAECRVCKIQWQVRDESDKEGCPWCGAGEDAVVVHRED